jgi:tetratricopeptide (TPR) repeat protein
MKRSTMTIVMTMAIVAAIVTPVAATAQQAPAKWPDTLNTEIERAQQSGDIAKISAAAALASRVAMAYPNDGLVLHYQGYALFRQATAQAVSGADGSALLQQSQTVLERSLKNHPLPETHMLLASIDGQLIAKNPTRAMELGMESQASSSAALAGGPNNPRVWLLRGQAAIFTPEEYGGGLSAAEGQLKHAVELFAKDTPKAGDPSWGKAEAYLWLGQVYEKKGDKMQAAAMYKQALDIAPNYSYAKSLAASLK